MRAGRPLRGYYPNCYRLRAGGHAARARWLAARNDRVELSSGRPRLVQVVVEQAERHRPHPCAAGGDISVHVMSSSRLAARWVVARIEEIHPGGVGERWPAMTRAT